MSTIYTVPVFVDVAKRKLARYVIISPQPENDVIAYMDKWAFDSGLLSFPGYTPRRIGWDFPYVSDEQRKFFGLKGYVAAYILPEGFTPECCGAEIYEAPACKYVMSTITDPHGADDDRIGGAYEYLLGFIRESGKFKEPTQGNICCFEEEYNKDGVEYMDVYIPVEDAE